MTTVVKIQPKLPAAVTAVLAPLAEKIYKDGAGTLVGIVELTRVDSNNPSVEDIKPTVFMRITGMEVGEGEQEHTLRAAARAIYAVRTADGTLDPDGEVALAEDTLRLTEGMLLAQEAARLRAGLAHFADLARERADDYGADTVKLFRHLRELAGGLAGLIHHTQPSDEE